MVNIVLLIIIVITAIIIAFIFLYRKKESFNSSTYLNNRSFPLDTGRTEKQLINKPSIWNYYGSKSDYLMDQIASGKSVKYPPKGIYCDRPNRNRNFLVNPIITQKSLFVLPDVNSEWGRSAFDVHPELEWQTDPIEDTIGENIFYSNFHKTLKDIDSGKINLNLDNYKTKCGLNGKVKYGTLNVPY